MPSKLTGIFATGKPVVAIANLDTEVSRVVKGRGIIIKPGDIKAFASSVVWLAENPVEREKLGKAGRAYAIDELNKNNILTQFENGLEDLVKIRKYKKRFSTGPA